MSAGEGRQRYNPDGHEEITHRCPVPFADGGDGTMPCCGRTPFQVPAYHRMNLDPALATCGGNRGVASPSHAPA